MPILFLIKGTIVPTFIYVISDEKVIQIFKNIPRRIFIPKIYRFMESYDKPLPIGHNQTISQPSLVAFMTEKLNIKKKTY